MKERHTCIDCVSCGAQTGTCTHRPPPADAVLAAAAAAATEEAGAGAGLGAAVDAVVAVFSDFSPCSLFAVFVGRPLLDFSFAWSLDSSRSSASPCSDVLGCNRRPRRPPLRVNATPSDTSPAHWHHSW